MEPGTSRGSIRANGPDHRRRRRLCGATVTSLHSPWSTLVPHSRILSSAASILCPSAPRQSKLMYDALESSNSKRAPLDTRASRTTAGPALTTNPIYQRGCWLSAFLPTLSKRLVVPLRPPTIKLNTPQLKLAPPPISRTQRPCHRNRSSARATSFQRSPSGDVVGLEAESPTFFRPVDATGAHNVSSPSSATTTAAMSSRDHEEHWIKLPPPLPNNSNSQARAMNCLKGHDFSRAAVWAKTMRGFSP